MIAVSVIVATVFVCVGLALLVHHGWMHSYDEPSSHAKTESSVWVGYFQAQDVAHIETWIVVLWANALCVALVFLVPYEWNSATMTTALAVCLSMGFLGLVLVLDSSVLYAIGTGPPWSLHNISNHETWIVMCWTVAIDLAWLEFVK